MAWGKIVTVHVFWSLTEEALLAVSIALGTDEALVAGGMMLEVVAAAAAVGMLRETPTDLQTSDAKARVTDGKRDAVSWGCT